MLDAFDYKEPACPLCGGAEFYNPSPEAPEGRVPVERILARADECFLRKDFAEAERLLRYWREEAVSLKDLRGQLTLESELVGFFRKTNRRGEALAACERCLTLVERLGQGALASGATVLLNCATAYKAFGLAVEALPLYRRAEQVYAETLTPGDARFGGLYNNMALALVDVKAYSEALSCYDKALAVMEALPHGQADAAITYVNLAHLYEATGESDRILDVLARAFELLMSEELPRDGYYAFVCEKCAPSFGYFGYGSLGEELMKEAGKVYEGA